MARVPKYDWVVYKGRRAGIKVSPTFVFLNEEITIGPNDTIILVVKKGEEVVIRKEVLGDTYIRLIPSDTNDLEPSETLYKYDIYLAGLNPEDEIQLVERSKFIVIDTNEYGSE